MEKVFWNYSENCKILTVFLIYLRIKVSRDLNRRINWHIWIPSDERPSFKITNEFTLATGATSDRTICQLAIELLKNKKFFNDKEWISFVLDIMEAFEESLVVQELALLCLSYKCDGRLSIRSNCLEVDKVELTSRNAWKQVYITLHSHPEVIEKALFVFGALVSKKIKFPV